jgi:hypothetical protein
MKKSTIIAVLFLSTLGLVSCNSNSEENAKDQSSEQTSENNLETSTEATTSIEEIDQLRGEIESLDIVPVELSTAELREKIKQKWSKIHFYVKDNKVVKVKTYPHSEISKRTEEFYALEEVLALVVIEDNGDGDKGKAKSELDKMYYFDNGKLLKEVSNEKETEHTIKESDAEELLSEFNEYLELYKNTNS